MKFPSRKYESAEDYCAAYLAATSAAAGAVDCAMVGEAADLLAALFEADRTLFVCGNGGSAAISNHLQCDFAKGIQTDTVLRPRITSLSSQIEIITAIGNDIAFEDIFVYQLKTAARPGDALMTISSSGNSENIVRALKWACGHGLETISMTGFAGGRSKPMAGINLHVPAENYGIVEDVHQSMMHILAQYTRMRLMEHGLIGTRAF